MKHLPRTSVLLVIGLLAGCGTRPSLATPPAAERLPNATITAVTISPTQPEPTVVATDPPTKPPEPTSSSPAIIPTATVIPGDCLAVSPAPASELIRSGALVFENAGTISTLGHNLESRQLPGANAMGVEVSPYGDYVLWFNEAGLGWWKITGETGQVELDLTQWHFRQWLNGGRVLLWHAPIVEDNTIPVEDRFTVLSLLSGEMEEQTISLSRLLGTQAEALPWRSMPAYDPSLRLVIYAWQEQQDDSAQGLLLWDIASQSEVWVQGNWQWPLEYTDVEWSLDGSLVAIVGDGLGDRATGWPELVTVASTGENTQLTDFANSALTEADDFYMLWSLKWSPNGRYLAFVIGPVRFSSTQAGRLVVFDLVEQRLLDYCNDNTQYPAGSIYWSPTSEQLAFIGVPDYGTYVLDMARSNLTRLEAYGLRGWVNVEAP